MSKRLASLKKKTPNPTPVKKISLPKHVYLYYSPDCEFCKELIRILIIVPDLANRVKCIDIAKFDVDPSIDSIPLIDEGTDEDDEKVLHKLEGAFTWVIHQCYILLEQKKIEREELVRVEQRVHNVFMDLQRLEYGEVKDRELMRENTGVNPHDKYKSRTGEDPLAVMDYSGKQRSKDLYRKSLLESSKKPRPKGSISDRIKNFEKERTEMLNKYKRKWEKQGGAQEHKTIKRESLRSVKGISETQVKQWESDRIRMLDGIASQYTGGIREPIKRHSIKMGSSVSDKDLHDFQQQRQKMLEKIRSKYA